MIARPARPALVPCMLWLAAAGLAAHTEPAPAVAASLLAIACATGLALAWVGHRRAAGLLAVLVGLALWHGSDAFAAHRERIDRLFGDAREVLDLEIEGSLVRAPERGFDGTRVLEVETHAPRYAGPARVRLRVAASPAARGLDALVRGDRVRAWCRLVRPAARVERTGPSPSTFAAAHGLAARGSVKSALLVVHERSTGGWWSAIDRIGHHARARLDRALGTDGPLRALTAAMLLGDRELLDPPTVRALRDAGLVHIVAISGLQVTLVVLVLMGMIRRARLPRPVVLVLALLLLWAFGCLVGTPASVLRAIGAAIVLETGRALGRDGDALNSLALVAALLVVVAPCSIADPGLQLSVAATFGILAGARPIARRVPLPGFLALPCGVTLGAYLATAPIVAWWFGRLAPAAVVTNLLAAPLAAAALAVGYPALLLADLPGIGTAALRLAGLPSTMLLAVAEWGAALPAAFVVVPRPGAPAIAVYYLSLLVAWSGDATGHAARRIAVAALALATLWIHLGRPPLEAPRSSLEAAVLDVGQGQAVAVRAPRSAPALIDAAGSADPRFDPGERIVVPWLVEREERRVAILAVSHEHADHAGGAFAVLRDLEVGEVWLPIGWEKSRRLADLAALARERGVAVGLAERGVRLSRGELRVAFLAPGRDDRDLSANDRSIVLRIGARACSLLVPGDLDPPGERALVRSGEVLASEALVVPHHGSRHGSSASFLERVRPRVAIVSCGSRNRFGHPHAETLGRLREAGATIARTDRLGTLSLVCGPAGFEILTDRRSGSERE